MSAILAPILSSWNSPRPSDPQHVLTHYICHPDSVACTVACLQNGQIFGFQALKRASSQNPYGLPQGWGIIGTYVSLNAPRAGIGRKLFAASLKAAQEVNLNPIDATIGASNAVALAYYEAMGFQTYRYLDGAIGKRFDLAHDTG